MDKSPMREKILAAIINKSTLKQHIFDNTFTTFNELKDVLFEIASELDDDLDGMLDKYKAMSEQVISTTDTLSVQNVPSELLSWLVAPLTLEPDEYIDYVYERLVETYRPCIGIDRATMMPVYDYKYKAVLDKILERFTDYEDSYYEGNE
jgi:hypothetical protein